MRLARPIVELIEVSVRLVSLLSLTALIAVTACSSGGDIVVEVAPVDSGEVVQTIAAAAELEPAGRVTVTAPAGGEVAELLVADGDIVSAGDPLVRLASDAIDQQVAQAEGAVEAADALAASAGAAGFDLSPVVGAFRAQLDAVFPPLIASLGDQIDVLEAAVDATQQQLADTRRRLDAADEAAGDLVDLLDPDREAADEGAQDEGAQDEGAQDEEASESPGETSELPDVADAEQLEAALASARQRLAEAQGGYEDARRQLADAESQTRTQAEGASAAQEAAAAAQRDQAELALESARARIDDLVIVAPADGVVELARGGGEAAPGGAPDPGALGGFGGLEGLLGGGSGASSAGSVAEGIDVGPGQTLLTIFDLSGFTARVDVDEIDVVDVDVGQEVVVLVDAFPEAELLGRVSYVALSPQRQAGGGAIFPVTVELREVPAEVRLRVGLTASAEIEVRRVAADTVVPTSALLRRGGGEVVYVVRDGIAEEVAVTLEAIGDDTAAVSGDLRLGDEVVTIGVENVEDGTEVEVVP